METVCLSERREHAAFISYLYNAVLADAVAIGGASWSAFGAVRAVIGPEQTYADAVAPLLADAVVEVLCIGYKYRFLQERLNVRLPRRERRLFAAALIAADLAGDAAYVRRKLPAPSHVAVDGVYCFRLAALREKWERIVRYIPAGFGAKDLVKFCTFLAEESENKIYLKGSEVYGADFSRLRRSRLLGEEDAEAEIVLSDAGFIYCLGDVADPLADFLQKYYAERAIFS